MISSTIQYLFLDTSVILGRIFEHENLNKLCERILTNNKYNYTSETVQKELLQVIRRRKDYHVDLIELKARKAKGSTLNHIINAIAFNNHDKRFLQSVRSFLLDQYPGENWLSMYRTYIQTSETLLDECLNEEIQNPLIIPSADSLALEDINKIIQNINDCQIFLDMIYGFIDGNKTVNFVTKDVKDFIKHKTNIKQWFNDFFHQKCFFCIYHVVIMNKLLD
jgi:hypothetical protein